MKQTTFLWALVALAIALGPVSEAAEAELDCLVAPHITVSVSTQATGVLESVPVDRGDLVKQGQVLATLESSVERAAVAVNNARAELANRRLAELELGRAVAELEQRTIRSPIAGVVTRRLLSPGEFVNHAPIVELAQLDPLRVEVFVPIAMLGRVSVGGRGQVTPETPVGGIHTARVTVVDRVLDAASGTFGVRLALPNPGYRLPAGLRCKVRFIQ